MENNEIIESFLQWSYRYSITKYFEFIKSHILAISQLFRNWTFENLYIFIEVYEVVMDRRQCHNIKIA